jgi:hypothetical protein
MNNLINIQERIDIMQAELNILKSLAEQATATPKYVLSDLIREVIEQEMDNFIREEIIGNLDCSYTAHARGDGFSVEIDCDLQEIVEDQLESSHRLASKFIDKLINELDSLKQQEENETTEQREEQREDSEESQDN